MPFSRETGETLQERCDTQGQGFARLASRAPRDCSLFFASVRRFFANNVCCQLYIQILAQYNSEVLHARCREGYVCADRLGRSRQQPPLRPSFVKRRSSLVAEPPCSMFTRYASRFTLHGCRERRMGKGASLGEEAVLADAEWAGEVTARVWRVRTAVFSAFC